MSCPDATLVQGFVEGTLGEAERGVVEQHVDGCSICRRLVGAIMETRSETATPPTLDDSPHAQRRKPLALGSMVGRYRIAGYLGKGGMGIVYAAHDPELRRDLALKLLRPDRARDGSDPQARLAREAQAMAQIAHPNVIGVFDVGTWQGEVFVAMELATAGTLRGWCDAKRTPAEIIDAYIQAGRGLAAAHAAGLVHRDFKPDNVLVGSDGRMRVTDFGLARPHDASSSSDLRSTGAPLSGGSVPPTPRALPIHTLTQSGALLGTPGYMAPELYVGAPSDARSDQFAFCVALWEALYRQRPFSAANEAELVEAIEQGAIREPADRRGVPSSVERALRRGLDADAAKRWPSMHALLDALALRRVRRPWRFVAGALTLAALGAIGFVVWPAHADESKPPVKQFTADETAAGRDSVEYMRKAIDHWTHGDRAEAHRDAEASVESARHAGMPEMLATALQTLAFMLQSDNDLKGAEARLLESIELAESIGADSIKSKGVFKLVEVLGLEGKTDDAKRWQTMVDGAAARPSNDDDLRANALEAKAASIADLEGSLEKYNEALVYRDRSDTLELRATNRVAAAAKLFNAGLYDQARAVLLDSLKEIARRGRDALDITIATAGTLDELAVIDISRLDWRSAEDEARRAIALWTSKGTPTSPFLRATYQNLGSALAHQGKLPDARAAFARALELSPDDIALAATHAWIAIALHDDKALRTEAVSEGELAVEYGIRAHGLDHPDVLTYQVMLAKLYATARDRAHAVPLAERLLRQLELRTDEPLALADIRFVLAQMLPVADRARARTLAEQALATYRTAGAVRVPHRKQAERWLANPDADD